MFMVTLNINHIFNIIEDAVSSRLIEIEKTPKHLQENSNYIKCYFCCKPLYDII